MTHDDSNETYHRRRSGAPTGNEFEQGAILRAEMAAQGHDASPRETFTAELLRITNEYQADRITRTVESIRPELVGEFGEAATASVVGHVGFAQYAVEMGERDRDADDAAYAALDYLRQHPDATPADAFTALTAPGAD
ncbi:hypothetical protein ACIOHE_39420 [Streptomyces sp. NPDC087851]|uniref:hypothetical protein n=1 Tax=Streptomyces sp. NPDC087851 TaxID=3365810 RepID=UPI0037F4384F